MKQVVRNSDAKQLLPTQIRHKNQKKAVSPRVREGVPTTGTLRVNI